MSAPRWLPIESNPDVMNKFLYNVGLKKSWAITDVLGLDDELLEMVPKPVVSVILLFPVTENVSNYRKEKMAEIEKAENKVSEKVYFMKQTIRNACGTVAMIHAVANNQDVLALDSGFLKNFLDATKDASPEERAKNLENDQSVCDAHDEVAKEGQTAAPPLEDEVDFHFVAFIHKDGHLYELDGNKSGPLNCGVTSAESFLKDAAAECKKYMAKDPENINFTVLALAGADGN